MRSFNPLLVIVLSFVSFVLSGPLQSSTHSSRLARNPISSRQFHYPRALVDICAEVDLSLPLTNVVGLNLRGVSGNICLCLSAFPLNLRTDSRLQVLAHVLGETQVDVILKSLVRHAIFRFPIRTLSPSFSGR
jgi:hypothetical protein